MSAHTEEPTGELLTVTGLSESERHRVLAADRRRTVLDALAEMESPSTVGALACAVAAREARAADAAPDRTNVLLTLHHAHLPLLDRVGIVDYDHSTTDVEDGRVFVHSTLA